MHLLTEALAQEEKDVIILFPDLFPANAGQAPERRRVVHRKGSCHALQEFRVISSGAAYQPGGQRHRASCYNESNA
ncbi:MAG TPA: hypothetical protein VKQ36_00855 [Ktedonobacterales bacterium]|nr:hypothetical protein [Ktedonobacterales bacterium]